MSATKDVTEDRKTPIRSLSVRPDDLQEAQRECRRLNVKQVDLLGVLLRAWKSLPANKQTTFIPNDLIKA